MAGQRKTEPPLPHAVMLIDFICKLDHHTLKACGQQQHHAGEGPDVGFVIKSVWKWERKIFLTLREQAFLYKISDACV